MMRFALAVVVLTMNLCAQVRGEVWAGAEVRHAVLDHLNSELPEENALKAVHRGAADDGCLSPTLQKAENIPTGMNPDLVDKQNVITALRRVYTEINPDWENLWPVTRDWLRKLQTERIDPNDLTSPFKLDPTLVIID